MIFKKDIDENTKIEIEYDLNEHYPVRALTVNGEKFDFFGPEGQRNHAIKWAFEYLYLLTDLLVHGSEEVIEDLSNNELEEVVDKYYMNIKDHCHEQAFETTLGMRKSIRDIKPDESLFEEDDV